MKRNLSVVAGVFLGCLTLTPATSAETLQDVITRALQTNPEAQASLNRYRAEMQRVDVAWGDYLPTVDLSAGLGTQQRKQLDADSETAQDDNTYTRKDAAVSIRQSLFSGFSTTKSVEQSRHRARAEQLRMLNTLEELSLRVVDVYLKVLERRDVIDLAVENVKMHDEIYGQIKKRTQQGVARSSDLAQIEGAPCPCQC